MDNYVEGYFYHKDYTGSEGKFITFDDGETAEGLANRGWVDSPAKAGHNPWGPESQKQVEEIEGKFRAQLLPAIESDSESSQKMILDANAQAEADRARIAELEDQVRQHESGEKLAIMREEQLLDEKNDANTLGRIDQAKPVDGILPDTGDSPLVDTLRNQVIGS